MNKTFKLAISAVLGAAMVTPAFAQREGFPDISDQHWAKEAVERLKKEGIITGYPDGTFQGKKFITRYELATLIYAIYSNLKNVTDSLNAQIEALETKVNSMKSGGGSSTSNDAGLRDALNALKGDVNSLKAWGDDITSLKKMASTYEKELASLGVDVEAMKKDLASLSARVTALENAKPAVAISGDVNFFVSSGIRGNQGGPGLNQDGRFNAGNANGAGIDTLSVGHELGLKLKTQNASGANAVAELVVGNLAGGTGGFINSSTQASAPTFGAAYNEGSSEVYIHNMYATFSDSLGGLNFDAKVGRQGIKLSPWVLSRFDNTSFFANERYDNGEYQFDGANIGLKFGANTDLHLFLGNQSNFGTTNQVQSIILNSEQGSALAPVLGAGNQLVVERVMGAALGFKLGGKANVKAAFVSLDGTGATAATANRAQVIGIDLDYALSDSITLTAGAGSIEFRDGNSSVAGGNDENDRTNFGLNWKKDKLSLGANYSRVERNYVAPGDWGRFGHFRNVTGYTFTSANLGYQFSDKLALRGSVLRGRLLNGPATDKDVEQTVVGLDYKINSNWSLMGSYERNIWGGATAFSGADVRFTTIGLGYDLGANTLFNLFYQRTEANNFLAVPASGSNTATTWNGGFVGAQLSVKF
jgi:hypothetical protein